MLDQDQEDKFFCRKEPLGDVKPKDSHHKSERNFLTGKILNKFSSIRDGGHSSLFVPRRQETLGNPDLPAIMEKEANTNKGILTSSTEHNKRLSSGQKVNSQGKIQSANILKGNFS